MDLMRDRQRLFGLIFFSDFFEKHCQQNDQWSQTEHSNMWRVKSIEDWFQLHVCTPSMWLTVQQLYQKYKPAMKTIGSDAMAKVVKMLLNLLNMDMFPIISVRTSYLHIAISMILFCVRKPKDATTHAEHEDFFSGFRMDPTTRGRSEGVNFVSSKSSGKTKEETLQAESNDNIVQQLELLSKHLISLGLEHKQDRCVVSLCLREKYERYQAQMRQYQEFQRRQKASSPTGNDPDKADSKTGKSSTRSSGRAFRARLVQVPSNRFAGLEHDEILNRFAAPTEAESSESSPSHGYDSRGSFGGYDEDMPSAPLPHQRWNVKLPALRTVGDLCDIFLERYTNLRQIVHTNPMDVLKEIHKLFETTTTSTDNADIHSLPNEPPLKKRKHTSEDELLQIQSNRIVKETGTILFDKGEEEDGNEDYQEVQDLTIESQDTAKATSTRMPPAIEKPVYNKTKEFDLLWGGDQLIMNCDNTHMAHHLSNARFLSL
ncbi:hypothetical protein RFI_23917 [Reticulomyxa filosa]|uniref:Uncharacterized protein n=1 Tax=Reticulomyxa filosa TaxID=46433 RepID=X6MK71_RETFI|nr:hypothetical protein RFI_23917 [Reticulomyxa filosa]|eukprot:ETO13455.1 hypothetical protein RFI_23917 [Reticulomyxa filosa]